MGQWCSIQHRGFILTPFTLCLLCYLPDLSHLHFKITHALEYYDQAYSVSLWAHCISLAICSTYAFAMSVLLFAFLSIALFFHIMYYVHIYLTLFLVMFLYFLFSLLCGPIRWAFQLQLSCMQQSSTKFIVFIVFISPKAFSQLSPRLSRIYILQSSYAQSWNEELISFNVPISHSH